MNILTIILMANPNPEQGSGWMNMVFIGAMILVFYFFMIRPQAKKAKDQKKFREALKPGDRVVTIGGIHGKINEVKETTLVIQTEDNSKLRIEKSAISKEFSSTDTAQSGALPQS